MNIFKKKFLLFYFFGFLSNLLIFTFLFHINFGIETFFYKGILITVISLILQFIILYKINDLKVFLINKLHIYIVCLATFCFTLTLHTLVLTSLDRAISIFFIGFMAQNEKGLSKQEIKDTFYKNYFEKDDAIGRRIEEQIITGNLVYQNEIYLLTERGKATYKTLSLFSKLFNVNNKYINPDYNFK